MSKEEEKNEEAPFDGLHFSDDDDDSSPYSDVDEEQGRQEVIPFPVPPHQQQRQSEKRKDAPPSQQQQQQAKGAPPPQQRQSQQRQGAPPQQQQQQQQKSQSQQRREGPPEQREGPTAPPGPRPRREKNKDFQDVDTTGHWGSISKKEMIAVAIVLLAIVGGVVAAIVILVGGGDSDIASTPAPAPAPTPIVRPDIAPELQLPVIVQAVQSNSFTNNATSPFMSEDVAFYTADLVTDKTQPPSVRATSWVLNEDPRNPAPSDPWLVLRYAIATLYFAFTGEEWTKDTNWLTDDHVCGWHGVVCDRFNKKIIEIDLTGNNLAGSIPAEIGLLSDLRSIVLQRNKITGTIPSENFGSLPVLSILFLNDNQLSGDLVLLEPLRDNGVLSTMFIQQNNINGRWPRTFCPRSGQEPVFLGFGLDCTNMTRCLCCAADNCY